VSNFLVAAKGEARGRAKPFVVNLQVSSHGDIAIDYLRFIIDYLISSLRPLCPLWQNKERRNKEIFLEFKRLFACYFV